MDGRDHDEGKARGEATASDSEFHSYDDLLTNGSQKVLHELLMSDFHEKDFAGYENTKKKYFNGHLIWQIYPQIPF